MRSALLCVFFTLIIHKEGSQVRGDDFRPTPIPLDEWHTTPRGESSGTLHETIKTESPPSVAAVPAHYWEDALRHSVYLTLVRDKIDQLIIQGDVIAPNSKLDQPSKEIDDHDLWEKIKKAPFDRRHSEEVNSLGDVAIMTKGRLLENEEGFRFTEDDKSQDNCSDERCAEGVKAFWSVKRVRQRDQETFPGKYHYELTFSVVSQIPKKQPKPYENPIRTFTVRETSPSTVEFPQEQRKYELFQTARPQRAIWFHKNIVPIPPHTRRQPYRGLDRIFSTIFSDDDDASYDKPQPKFRSNSASFPTYQYSKSGHAGPSVDYHQQPKSIPYPYKQAQPYKYIRPPLQAPPAGPLQHHYLDYESSPIINGNPYPPHDSRISPTQAVKTTRPAILPTPVPLTPPLKEQTFDLGTPMFIDSAESSNNITRYEINNSFKSSTKLKPALPKVNYFPEHIRPPVYNAPPGVFVTMDKKPFKPLPPLKHGHNSKPHRVNKPVDFRPSPQFHDSQSPNSDPLFETAFRPITVNYAETSTTETVEMIQVKKGNNKQRKTSSNSKKPTKKHHNVKTTRPVTTAIPDIITAQSLPDEDGETLDWANVLGAFTKTTPMVLQTEKLIPVETTTSFLLNSSTTLLWKKPTTVTEAPSETTTTPTTTAFTTIRPKKRTRPPPKFTKQDKFKKHKRINTISTSETTEYPEKTIIGKLSTEATPVSTTTRSIFKSFWDSKNKTHATSSTTTTASTARPTTAKIVTSTKQASTTPYTTTFASRETSTTPKPEIKQPSTHLPRNINRFRQSTLFYKGTSVKHDKWSFRSNGSQPQNHRRTSNFQGYVTSTTHATTLKLTQGNTSDIDTNSTTEKISGSSSAERLVSNSILPSVIPEDNETENSQEESEYIFEHSTDATDTSNGVVSSSSTIESIPAQFESSKNKTKCKKKKLTTTTIETPTESYPEQSTPKTTTEDSTDDIFEQLFGFNFDSETSTPKDMSKLELLEGESSHHASFLKADDDLTDFMAEFNKKHKHTSPTPADDYDEEDEDEDDDDDDDDDDFQPNDDDDSSEDENEDAQTESEENKESSRDSRYESYDLGRPYSFLELMAME
ncbi:unnamed protein product [Pieris brassicae]|uniref:Uncharacterized protein n=1 Tax=Pieris brassicae TaxID=7116 RepID=A0A9P0TEQ0_PIEBR|nr:unnamed protein product [Pieris brassicae]